MGSVTNSKGDIIRMNRERYVDIFMESITQELKQFDHYPLQYESHC